jgi:hypothetical protein
VVLTVFVEAVFVLVNPVLPVRHFLQANVVAL